MSSSKRYFQLTPEILLEYTYTTTGVIENGLVGDVSDRVIDLRGEDRMTVIGNNYDSSTYFYVNTTSSDDDNMTGIYANQSNFVLPLNKSHTKFIKYNNYDSTNDTYNKYKDSENIELKPYFTDGECGIVGSKTYHNDGIIDVKNDCDIVFDKLRFHFTGRNFMGNYDGIIIQAYIYDKYHKKIELMSFDISRQAHFTLNPEPMIINQKMYNTYIDAKIVSTDCLLYYIDRANRKISNDNYNYVGTKYLLNYLINYNNGNESRKDNGLPNRGILRNASINFEIYGIRGAIESRGYEVYSCARLNSIIVRNKDSYDGVEVSVEDADDGDYFKIQAKIDDRFDSFSDFIMSLSETYESYIIMHELSLNEYFINDNNQLRSEVTHREQFIVNAAVEDGGTYVINSDALDNEFLYRPICKYGSRCVKFTITDVLKIVDTNSNTTIVKTGKCDCYSPSKYGKKMNQIYLGEVPAQINVFNKRSDTLVDEDINTITFSHNPNIIKVEEEGGSGNGVQFVTNNIGITAFCETTDIRISVTDMVK